MDDHDLLTRPEVAEMLRTPIGTVAQWAWRGYGPPFMKVGRKTLYRRVDVERWLLEREREAVS